MSNRIVSNSSFAVNSDYEQIVSINNTSAINQNLTEVGGTAIYLGQTTATASLPVVIASDQSAVPISSSTALDVDLTNVGGTSFSLGANTSASSISVTLATDESTLEVDLDSVGGTAFSLGSTTSASSIPVVIASDQGAISVSFTNADNSGSEGNLSNSQSVVSGDNSTELDVRKARNITITGTTTDTSGNPININAAHTALGNKYPINYSIYPDANGYFYEKLENIAINYLTLEYNVTATVTATAIFN